MRNQRLVMKAILVGLPLLAANCALAAPGKVYATTSPACTAKVNVFGLKSDVYINGSGLPNGNYWVEVTEPGGTVLGKSAAPVVSVVGGNFVACYQVVALVFQAPGFVVPGFADTSNPGLNYKVAISTDPSFPSNNQEHDVFKVTGSPNPPTSTLRVNKFYDANANGVNDDGQPISGWEIRIQDSLDIFRSTPVVDILAPDTYTVTESNTLQSNWVHTTPNPLIITLGAGDDKTVEFGNVCTGAGGGKSKGYWGNKNGEATLNDGGGMASEFALLSGLNLRDGDGNAFDPANYASFKTWLGSSNAVNMAYMLSAQLAAVELSVEAGFVNGNSLAYAPGLLAFAPLAGLNNLGFISVNNLMTLANTELGIHGMAFAHAPWRDYQEAVKNVLDNLANDTSFVQPTPCKFSFPVQF